MSSATTLSSRFSTCSEYSVSSVESLLPAQSAYIDQYNELTNCLSALLFGTPSSQESRVLYKGIQSWLQSNAPDLKFGTLRVDFNTFHFDSDYLQQPTTLVLLLSSTNLPFGVALVSDTQIGPDVLVSFFLARNRTLRIMNDTDTNVLLDFKLPSDLNAWSDMDRADIATFELWTRANLAFFSKL